MSVEAIFVVFILAGMAVMLAVLASSLLDRAARIEQYREELEAIEQRRSAKDAR